MKRKSKSGQRLLTALLCFALCAADIMPVSMTVWASEQTPESIAADDNMSEIIGEDESDISMGDSESDSKEQEADSDHDQTDVDEENSADRDQDDAEEGRDDFGEEEPAKDPEENDEDSDQVPEESEEKVKKINTSQALEADNTFEIDYVIYEVISEEDHTVRLKGINRDGFNNDPSYGGWGAVEFKVPASVESDGITYSVTEIGEFALADYKYNENKPSDEYGADQSMGGTLQITKVIVSAGITKINKGAFYKSARISEIVLPDTVVEIGEAAFYFNEMSRNSNGYFSPLAVNIPASVKTIGDYAYHGVHFDNILKIPNGVETIGDYAFACSFEASGIYGVYIPESVKYIDMYAFDIATLMEAAFERTDINDSAIYYSSYMFGDYHEQPEPAQLTLYVPEDSMSTYTSRFSYYRPSLQVRNLADYSGIKESPVRFLYNGEEIERLELPVSDSDMPIGKTIVVDKGEGDFEFDDIEWSFKCYGTDVELGEDELESYLTYTVNNTEGTIHFTGVEADIVITVTANVDGYLPKSFDIRIIEGYTNEEFLEMVNSLSSEDIERMSRITYSDEISYQLDAIRSKAQEITADCSSDYDKIKAVHTWLADNIAYDYDHFEGRERATAFAHMPYGVLTYRYGVCGGYAGLARDMLRSIGIPCAFISGYADGDFYNNTSILHGWNMAYDKAGDRWIYFDSTWDGIGFVRDNYIGSYSTVGARTPSWFDFDVNQAMAEGREFRNVDLGEINKEATFVKESVITLFPGEEADFVKLYDDVAFRLQEGWDVIELDTATGHIKALKPGSAMNILASRPAGYYPGSDQIRYEYEIVAVRVLEKEPLEFETAELTVGMEDEEEYFKVNCLLNGNYVNPYVEMKSDNPDVLTVGQDGTLIVKNTGTANVTAGLFISASEVQYEASCTITVVEGKSILNDEKFKYRILSAPSNDKNGTVEIIDTELGKLDPSLSNMIAKLEIPASVILNENVYDVIGIGKRGLSKHWEDDDIMGLISEIVLPDTLQYIDEYAFYGAQACHERHSMQATINFPASLQRIGKGAFGLFELEGDIIFPEGSRLSYIGDGAFSGNGYLRNVDLSNCTGLKMIGDAAFSDCGFDSLLGEEASFEVKLPEALTYIGARAFEGDSTLKSIQIPSTVTSIGDEAFRNTGLTGMVDLGSVTVLGEGIFSGSTYGVETVILSDELDAIPKAMFNGTHNLKNVIAKSYYEQAGGQIEDGTFVLPTGVRAIGDDAFRGTGLTGTIDISGVSSIGQSVFGSCGGIETVILSDDLDEIPDGTFSLEDNLKNVLSKSCLDELGGIDQVQEGTVLLSDKIARIGVSAFDGCVYIQSVEARGVKELGEDVFSNCDKLKTVALSEEVTVIPDRAFRYCSVLEGFDFGDNIEVIGAEAFSNCRKLGQSTDEAIVLGSRIKTIGNEAFMYCPSISEVTIYSKVIESIGTNCFSSNPVLYVYQLPSGIYERALAGCVREIIYLSDEGGAVLTERNTTVILPQGNPIYNGYPQRPDPMVIVSTDGKEETIVQGTDYTVSYQNNINAGVAVVIITGMGSYSGTVSENFTIDKAELTIQAKDITLAIGDSLPAAFPYEAIGLAIGDEERLQVTGYSFTDQNSQFISKENIDTTKPGLYYVTVQVDAGNNYEVVESQKGRLTIAEERVGYTVIFDFMGHGTEVEIPGIKAGSLLNIDELEMQSDIDIPRDGELVTEENGQYIFTGWYKDKTFTAKQKWNFDTDTVQADTILYACWIEKAAEGNSGLQLSIQDIQDQYYTGSAIKPTVYVYAADGETLLKSGKDYTIKYVNNIEADTEEEKTKGGMGSTETDDSNGFNKDLAYVIIMGKGNYSEAVYKNFHILPADISADGENVAAGFTLKYSDQLVTNTKKDQNPFGSLKYKKAMKPGTDYMITLTAGDDVQCDGSVALEAGVIPSRWSAETAYDGTTRKYTAPVIPKGYYGTFTMKVEGVGNYTGSFTKTVMVTDKDHLMKNASISLGKNQKSLSYADGKAVTLTPGWYDATQKKYYRVVGGSISDAPEANANEIFTVKAGKTYLVEGEDYIIGYADNKAVGTATMTIVGMGKYMGTKSATFKITGTVFNTKNIVVEAYDAQKPDESGFRTPMTYTGKAITQNKVTLTTKGTDDVPSKPLDYGTHYTISYKNNIKKGTATMTFTAKPESGYTGSFNKTFKITAQSIAAADIIKVWAAQGNGHEQDSVVGLNNTGENITEYRLNGDIAYVKGGVKPSDRIVLTNGENITLKEGTDYTVKYKNNAAVTTPDMAENKKPCMTVTGKGNYAGTLTVYFDIGKAEISEEQIVVTPMALSAKESCEYKPSVKVIDSVSGKTLSAGENKDYTITYENNGQENVTKYVNGDESAAQPMAVVKMPSSGTGSYRLAEGVDEIKVPLPVYKTKLTSSNLYVVVSDEPSQTTYTGGQVTPKVTVYYGEAAAVGAAKKDKVTDETALTNPSGQYRLTKLKEAAKMSDTEPDTLPGSESDASQGVTGDYTITYGANSTAGKNKGSVTITGASKEYGGSVTVKFEILRRSVYKKQTERSASFILDISVQPCYDYFIAMKF